MGFEIVLENEDGSAIASIEDPTNFLHRVLPPAEDQRFRYLNVIDWYGDTTFNSLQIEGFRRELERVANTVTGPHETELLTQLDALAARCQSEPHVYLKFYGD